MGSSDSETRFGEAAALLDYGFAAYQLVKLTPDAAIPPVRVRVGTVDSVQPEQSGEQYMLLHKTELGSISYEIELPESVEAPVLEGQELGRVRVLMNGEEAAVLPLCAPETVARRSPLGIFMGLAAALFC